MGRNPVTRKWRGGRRSGPHDSPHAAAVPHDGRRHHAPVIPLLHFVWCVLQSSLGLSAAWLLLLARRTGRGSGTDGSCTPPALSTAHGSKQKKFACEVSWNRQTTQVLQYNTEDLSASATCAYHINRAAAAASMASAAPASVRRGPVAEEAATSGAGAGVGTAAGPAPLLASTPCMVPGLLKRPSGS